MVEAGQTFENPVQKERFLFRVTGAESDGELLRAELVLEPGGAVSVPHVHRHQEERWEIRSGEGRFRLGADERLAGPGDVVVAEPGTPHTLANAGDGELAMILELRPALRTGALFQTVSKLADQGAYDAKGRLKPLWALAVGREFRDEVAPPHVPHIAHRAVLALSGPVVRLAGYHERVAGIAR